MKKTLFIISLTLGSLVASAAPDNKQNVMDLKYSITDESIIYPETFEADYQKMLESWYMKNYTDTDDRYRTSSNPSTSDATIKERLAELPAVIELPFNQVVRSYIDRYVERGRPMVASLLGLSIYYMPIFEQALEAEQLTLELKYLPVIVSALNPIAVSRSGAGGLWQFMPSAARGYDLEISSLVDERRYPYKSSKKSAKMLYNLYDTYGDWSIAIAAYNCGPGNVNKAIRRAGGDPKQQDFWSIYQYLSPQTRGYVPMFIAANYVMNYYKDHNISPVLPTRPLVTDTVGISSRVHFEQISKVLNIPVEELRILNPQFRADIIPGSSKKQYMLILPVQQVQAYIMSEPEILAYESDKYARRLEATPGEPVAEEDSESPLEEGASDDVLAMVGQSSGNDADDIPAAETIPDQSVNPSRAITPAKPQTAMEQNTRIVTHTVAQGETINAIADRYEVKVSDIRSWNSLRRNAVRPGQKLRIETAVSTTNPTTDVAVASNNQSNSTSAQTSKNKKQSTTPVPSAKKQKAAQAKPVEHVIKSGETLSSIAKKHGVTVEELRKANNISGDNVRAGSSIKVPVKNSGVSGKKVAPKNKSSKRRKKRRR